MLHDYEDDAKLRQCMDAVNDPEDPSMLTRSQTLFSARRLSIGNYKRRAKKNGLAARD